MFDSELKSVKAIYFLHKMFDQLHESGIEIILCFGNHDGFYLQHATVPDFVHVFKEQVETISIQASSGEEVYFHGFSYYSQHVKEDKLSHYPLRGPSGVHIGILHGQEKGSEESNNYAPFTIPSLVEKQYDYWALGHIHQTLTLYQKPIIQYAGSIQGANRKEEGEKGGILVEFKNGQVSTEFISTSPVVWKKVVVDLRAEGTISLMIDKIKKEVSSIISNEVFWMIHLQLTISEDATDLFGKPLTENFLLEWFEESLSSYEQGYWIEHVSTKKVFSVDNSSDFHQAISSYITDLPKKEVIELVKEIYYQPSIYSLLSNEMDEEGLQEESLKACFELLEEVKVSR
ncbi:hypothetical protein G8O30_02910 [Mangrovibacillus cuniculi]|uniref:Calcineurin-like phosphoesterase domain-containing protein n=1 Tax=Mangrovibacillus cuniculi TaxID=2593652 RepID=A0A7S8HHB6_9BACI|nr:hypothetical protein G8O30_02910 [Mangrovibacillus cuniculi]